MFLLEVSNLRVKLKPYGVIISIIDFDNCNCEPITEKDLWLCLYLTQLAIKKELFIEPIQTELISLNCHGVTTIFFQWIDEFFELNLPHLKDIKDNIGDYPQLSNIPSSKLRKKDINDYIKYQPYSPNTLQKIDVTLPKYHYILTDIIFVIHEMILRRDNC